MFPMCLDLDLQCEELTQEEFGLRYNFEVMDAVEKMEACDHYKSKFSHIFSY